MQLFRVPFYILFLLLSLPYINRVSAQKTSIYYDYAWKSCDVAKATYLSVTEKTDSGYYRVNHFINGGKLQLIALFEDSACTMHHGNATWYYANGRLQRKLRMIHSKPEGVVAGYHNNGHMADSGTFKNGKPIGDVFIWHYNGYLSDSIAYVNDSSFVHVSWFDDGSLSSAGREINSKKYGPWVFYHPNGNKAAKEMYDNDKRINSSHYDEGGNEIPVDTNRHEQAAQFKGGFEKWRSYLGNVLVWPHGYRFENITSVVMQVEMTIDEKGKITNVYIVNPFHPAFDKIAYDAISKGPKWIPAIQHNRPVKYRFVQTVTFQE